ncbi:MAG: hypothetical protein QOE66_744, partial [Chloroflexota bacterium]|nr:hypothetical protein [Chloroflexota bacterium]
GAASGSLTGVTTALAAVAAENTAWRTSIADPVVAAMQRGSSEAVNAAIQVRGHERETSQDVSSQLLLQIDATASALAVRSDALNQLRVQATAFGVAAELAAACLSLLFVRRYGRTVGRDMRRRSRASAERIDIVSSLRTLQTQTTAERTAAVIAAALHRLPGVDIAIVFECTPNAIVTLAMVGLPGFPIHTGDTLPAAEAGHLRQRSDSGPWAERWARPDEPSAFADAMTAIGVKGLAVAPVHVTGQLVALIGVMTTDDEEARHLVEDLPAVGEFASVSQAILGPALVKRQQRTAGRLRISAAIKAVAFRPLFQPVIELATGTTIGFEALTRFDDGSPPDLTFAAAVDCGMGIQLELATLEAALRDAHRLPPDAWVSLNVSPALLAKGGGTLAGILAPAGRRTVLEVTEHETIDAYGPLREAMVRLGPGVKLAVDDAGAGAANFNHLVELRPDFVKIDIGLIRGVDTDPGRQAVVAGLVHFARRTGCAVIAEGVETELERATLIVLGVTLGQGYLLARPAPAEAWVIVAPERPRLVMSSALPRATPKLRPSRLPGEPPLLSSLPPVVH